MGEADGRLEARKESREEREADIRRVLLASAHPEWSARITPGDCDPERLPDLAVRVRACRDATGGTKNALDYLYYEWHDKPATTVTYGTVSVGRTGSSAGQKSPELHLERPKLP